jgi:hypothetical protein
VIMCSIFLTTTPVVNILSRLIADIFRTQLSSALSFFSYSPTIVSKAAFEGTKVTSLQEKYIVKLREHFLPCDLQCS